MAKITNKIVWITGASSGIGKEIVEMLASKNVRLILSSRRKNKLEKIKSSCKNQNFIKILPIDLSQPDTLKSKTLEAIAFFGRIDIIIHSGGISQRSFAQNTDIEVSRKLMEVNFFSTVIITKTLLPFMLKNKFGHIVAISSLVGKFGTPYRSSYAASKHALHGYYDSLRAEMWKKGIIVSIITPGLIKTDISLNALTEKGDAANIMDQGQAKGLSAKVCGEKIIKAIINEKEEVRIGGKETISILIKRFFPLFFSKIIRKANVR